MKTAVHTLSYTAEVIVFLFIGIGFVAFDHPYEAMGSTTMILCAVNLLCVRFISIWTVSFFANKGRSTISKITTK